MHISIIIVVIVMMMTMFTTFNFTVTTINFDRFSTMMFTSLRHVDQKKIYGCKNAERKNCEVMKKKKTVFLIEYAQKQYTI